jgi:hypothetical protein
MPWCLLHSPRQRFEAVRCRCKHQIRRLACSVALHIVIYVAFTYSETRKKYHRTECLVPSHPIHLVTTKYDSIMCMLTDASPSLQDMAIPGPTQGSHRPPWRKSVQSTHDHLPSMHSRITFPGDSGMLVLFVADISLYFHGQGVSGSAEREFTSAGHLRDWEGSRFVSGARTIPLSFWYAT